MDIISQLNLFEDNELGDLEKLYIEKYSITQAIRLKAHRAIKYIK